MSWFLSVFLAFLSTLENPENRRTRPLSMGAQELHIPRIQFSHKIHQNYGFWKIKVFFTNWKKTTKYCGFRGKQNARLSPLYWGFRFGHQFARWFTEKKCIFYVLFCVLPSYFQNHAFLVSKTTRNYLKTPCSDVSLASHIKSTLVCSKSTH